MKIYTKTGDKGQTSLIGGKRVYKHDIRIEAYGTVDELNSYLGLIICLDVTADDKRFLEEIQNKLFTIGSNLASEEASDKLPEISLSDINALETEIDKLNTHLPVLKTFILPGGTVAASNCHIARSVCRRAERNVVELKENSFVDEKIIIYLNRLSDYLFTLAKKINFDSNINETPWISGR